MSVCVSTDCPKFGYCARARGKENKAEDCVNWANYRSVYASADGPDTIMYACGPSGDYKKFEPLLDILEPVKSSSIVIQCDEIILTKGNIKLDIDCKFTPSLDQFEYIEINGVKFKRE